MVPWLDYQYWTALAQALDCIIWWHIGEDGDYLPLLMPMPRRVTC